MCCEVVLCNMGCVLSGARVNRGACRTATAAGGRVAAAVCVSSKVFYFFRA